MQTSHVSSAAPNRIRPRFSNRAQALLLLSALSLTASTAALSKRYAPLTSAPPLAVVEQAPKQSPALSAHASPAETQANAVVNDTQPAVLTVSALNEPSSGLETQTQESLRVDDLAEQDIITPRAGAMRYFDGRPLRVKQVIWMEVTAYSPDERSCGKWADGITASNKSVWTNGMRLVAADTSILPFGSLVSMPTYAGGDVVPVLDRGGAIKGHRLDVLYATHERALQFGRQRIPVTIWEYADEAS